MTKILPLLLTSVLSFVNGMEIVSQEDQYTTPIFNQEAYNQTKKTVLEKFPNAMGSSKMDGSKKIDLQAVAAYRAAFEAIEKEDEEFEQMAMVEHQDILIPFAQKALKYASKLEEERHHISILIKEIKGRLESKDINPQWLLYMGLRIQAAGSHPSVEEIEVFSHSLNPGEKMLKSLYHRDAWKSHEKTAHALENFQEKDYLHLITHYDIPHSDFQCILKHVSSLQKELPDTVFYPLFFTGGLDFAYIAENILDEIYPIAHSLHEQRAHGIDMTSISYTIHDYLHTKLDPRRRALVAFFAHELDKQIESGDITLKSAPIVINYTKKVYALYKDALKQLLHLYLAKLATDENLPAFQRAMAAMHHLFHESTDLSPKVFEESDFDNVLKYIVGQSPLEDTKKSSNKKVFSWESSTDPLVTSPIDGSSSLTDAEIIAQLKLFVDPSLELPDTAPYTIKESRRFIDVMLTTERGAELHYSFPTLFHKWNNAYDYVSLLEYAGTKIQKPSLDGLSLRSQRHQAITLLTTIKKEAEILSNDFLKTSVMLSSKSTRSNGMSLKAAYALAFNDLKSKYETKLSIIERMETQAMKKQKELEKQTKK